ncbi:hypothetical protein B7494_g7666 [Chlorociboria aeruginascens]|nr:hypothetical protein B7494_g7666 [Chlorociboria aeruginascens]
MIPILTLTLLLTHLTLGAPTSTSSKTCREYTIPLNLTSQNYIWGLPQFNTNYDLAAFNTQVGSRVSNATVNPASETEVQTAGYEISGTYCAPANGGNGNVLLATHGIGFDRSYWDPAIQPQNYSFVDFATTKGYSIFYYDRLGLGKSSKVSGYISQVSVQVAALEQLVLALRAGKIGTTPRNVILIGHSFGSVVSNGLLTLNPNIIDGAVLTGIGYEAPSIAVTYEALQPRLARLASPSKWGGLDSGYLTWIDIFSNINVFFSAPFYDPHVVAYAEETKNPFAVMETISLELTNSSAPHFEGPIFVISGEHDFIFCGGYCPGILEPGALNAFPASKNVVTYSQPGAGHAINLSLNATGSFEVIINFLGSNGF